MTPSEHEQGGYRSTLSAAERRRFDEIAELLEPELDVDESSVGRLGTTTTPIDRWWICLLVAVVGVTAAAPLARWSVPGACVALTTSAIALVEAARHLDTRPGRPPEDPPAGT